MTGGPCPVQTSGYRPEHSIALRKRPSSISSVSDGVHFARPRCSNVQRSKYRHTQHPLELGLDSNARRQRRDCAAAAHSGVQSSLPSSASASQPCSSLGGGCCSAPGKPNLSRDSQTCSSLDESLQGSQVLVDSFEEALEDSAFMDKVAHMHTEHDSGEREVLRSLWDMKLPEFSEAFQFRKMVQVGQAQNFLGCLLCCVLPSGSPGSNSIEPPRGYIPSWGQNPPHHLTTCFDLQALNLPQHTCTEALLCSP